MCGIVAVLSRSDDRPPIANELLAPKLEQVVEELKAIDHPAAQISQLRQAVDLCDSVNHRLRSLPGVRRLVDDPSATAAIKSTVKKLTEQLIRIDAELDTSLGPSRQDFSAAAIAEATELAGRLADGVFAIARDRLRTAAAITDLAANSPTSNSPASLTNGLWAIQIALSALDRLEVRGRDSAGLQVFISPANGALEPESSAASFTYKVAAEIGELGDNTAHLRQQISQDKDLLAALSVPDSQVAVLAHTRWASVGIISEQNAHPLDGWELTENDGAHCAAVLNGDVDNYIDLKESNDLQIAPEVTTDAKVIPTLLRRSLLSAQATGTAQAVGTVQAAFAATVNDLAGSVAIAAHTSAAPGHLALALRGSGQALYVGSTDNAYIVASEPYGLVETVDHYLRMTGETPADPDNPIGSRGQIILLASTGLADTVLANTGAHDSASIDRLLAVNRCSYDGTSLPVEATEITTAKITTRDIDRGDAPHFFLKEIREAPRSFRTTLRGRIEHASPRSEDNARVNLEDSAFPPKVRHALSTGAIKHIVAIGQGTAAIAASALPHFCEQLWAATGSPTAGSAATTQPPLVFPQVSADLATELSGFGLSDDMSDTLVVAVSQSGTTTDLNRTVELARARGAVVLAIVNRRNSDLTDRADGVLYTSDGRDVEMSVASTKAFYAQVAALALLATAICTELCTSPPAESNAPAESSLPTEFITELLNALEAMPDAIEEVLASRAEIAQIARRYIGPKRHWAVVGNGANFIAAREIRIKLSELCYHAVAEDSTENKKHIDLSSEPLILVCAAGAPSSVIADVVKEVDIYRAHRSTPVVFATQSDQFAGAVSAGTVSDVSGVVAIPAVHPELDFVLVTVAGHLFAYEAARVIDSLADPLREMRVSVEAAIARYIASSATGQSPTGQSPTGQSLTGQSPSSSELLSDVAKDITAPANRFLAALQVGTYDGHLRVATALRLTTVLPFVQGFVQGFAQDANLLEKYQQTLGKIGTPATVLEDLEEALNTAIDELSRPVDTIKHQAKSVTVGISRAEDSLLESLLVAEAIDAGAPRDRLSYAALQTLAALDPAVEAVTGYTRYRIEGEVTADSGALHESVLDLTRQPATIDVIDRGGIAREILSRTAADPRLRGTKHRAAFEREVSVGRGSDGRTVIHVPETKDGRVVGLTLLHCQFASMIPAHQMRAVMRGYRGRYGALVDAVTEALPTFDDQVLGQIDVVDLLTRPVYVLAENWINTGD